MRLSQITAPPGPWRPPRDRTADRHRGWNGLAGAGAGAGGLLALSRRGLAATGGRAARRRGCAPRGQRPDHLLDLRIQAVDAQQRLPLRGGGREVARVPGELPARQQVEDQVLPLGHRLDGEVLRRPPPAAAAAPRPASRAPVAALPLAGPGPTGLAAGSAALTSLARTGAADPRRHQPGRTVSWRRAHDCFMSIQSILEEYAAIVGACIALRPGSKRQIQRGGADVVVDVGAPCSSRFRRALPLQDHRVAQVQPHPGGQPAHHDGGRTPRNGRAALVAAVGGHPPEQIPGRAAGA